MKITLPCMLAGLLLSMLCLNSRAELTIKFIEPERFSDAGRGQFDMMQNLKRIEAHLQKLGASCLTLDQSLDLQITNIDLAGRQEFWQRGNPDLRVMRDITWPQMQLHYIWKSAQGNILADQQERIHDMNYLMRSKSVGFDNDPLAYDKAMLNDWFEKRFCSNGSKQNDNQDINHQ